MHYKKPHYLMNLTSFKLFCFKTNKSSFKIEQVNAHAYIFKKKITFRPGLTGDQSYIQGRHFLHYPLSSAGIRNSFKDKKMCVSYFHAVQHTWQYDYLNLSTDKK